MSLSLPFSVWIAFHDSMDGGRRATQDAKAEARSATPKGKKQWPVVDLGACPRIALQT